MCFENSSSEKGFSIGEVILSVFIVATVLVIIVSVMSTTLRTFFEDRDIVIATNLSQEGVELVRNIRDNDFVSGNDFGEGLGDTPGPKNYIIEREKDLREVSDSGNEYLYFSDNEGYSHSRGGDQTKFSRRIIIEGEDDERIVVSVVIWDRDIDFPDIDECVVTNNCVMAKSILTNWGEHEESAEE